MKVVVVNKAFYNESIVNVGETIDFEGKKLPSWAKKVNSKVENKKTDEVQNDKVMNRVQNDNKQIKVDNNQVTNDGNKVLIDNTQSQVDKNQVQVDKNNNDTEKEQYLEALINEAVEKGILIEDSDKKSTDEKIKELEAKLNKESK